MNTGKDIKLLQSLPFWGFSTPSQCLCWELCTFLLFNRSYSTAPMNVCLFITWNAGLDEAQARIKIAGRNINNLRYADDTTLMAESEEELKNLLLKVKEESETAGLIQHSKNKDHGIQSHHFMANKWENNGNSERLIYFPGLQNHCRWWLQPWN